MNVQGSYIETDELIGFDPKECESEEPKPVSEADIDAILEH